MINGIERRTGIQQHEKNRLFLVKGHWNIIDYVNQLSLHGVVLPIGQLKWLCKGMTLHMGIQLGVNHKFDTGL